MNKKVYLTKKGLEELEKEYEVLTKVKRPAVIREIQETRSLGDLSENAGWHSAKEQQTFIESRIAQIEEILKNAEVKDSVVGVAGVGSKITVQIDGQKEYIVYELVSSSEASPAEGKISYESPIGSSLLNSKPGDIVSVQTPVGQAKYKIINVE